MSAVDRGMAMEQVFSSMAQQGLTPRLGPSRGSRNLRAAVLQPPSLREWDDVDNLAGFGESVLGELRRSASRQEIDAVFGEEIGVLSETYEQMTREQKAQFGKSVRRQFGNQAYEGYLQSIKPRESVSRDPIQDTRVGFIQEAQSGLLGGWDAMIASYHGNRALNTPDEEARNTHLDRGQARLEQAAGRPSDAPSVTEIDSVRSAAKWFTRVATENIPNMAAPMAAGFAGAKTGATIGAVAGPVGIKAGALAGGMLGAFYVASRMYRGGLYNTLAEAGVDHELAKDTSIKYGDLAGAASMVVPGTMMGMISSGLGRNFVRSKVMDTLMYAGGALAAEGLAEAIAESFVITGEELALGVDMDPGQKRERILNAAAAGAVIGGAMGGATGAARSKASATDVIDELIISAEKTATVADRELLQNFLQADLRGNATELTPAQRALFDYLNDTGKPSNRQINRGVQQLHQRAFEVSRRDAETNVARFTEIMAEGRGPQNAGEAFEVASILGQVPQLRQAILESEAQADVDAGADADASTQTSKLAPESTPIPEPEPVIQTQLQAVLDPANGKDTMLITPDSFMPDLSTLPEWLVQVQMPEGLLLTSDPEKAQAAQAALQAPADQRDQLLGQLLYNRPEGKESTENLVIRVLDRDGRAVTEVATSRETLDRDQDAVKDQVPTGGSLRITTVDTALRERQKGWGSDRDGRMTRGSYPIADEILRELGVGKTVDEEIAKTDFDGLDFQDSRTIVALKDVIETRWPDQTTRNEIFGRLSDPSTPKDDPVRQDVLRETRERMSALEQVEFGSEDAISEMFFDTVDAADSVTETGNGVPVTVVDGSPVDNGVVVHSRQIAEGGRVLNAGESKDLLKYPDRSEEQFIQDTLTQAAERGRRGMNILYGRESAEKQAVHTYDDAEYALVGSTLLTVTGPNGKPVTFHLPTLTSGGIDLRNAIGRSDPEFTSNDSDRLHSFLHVLTELSARGYNINKNTLNHLTKSSIFGNRNHKRRTGKLQTLEELLQLEYRRLAENTPKDSSFIQRQKRNTLEGLQEQRNALADVTPRLSVLERQANTVKKEIAEIDVAIAELHAAEQRMPLSGSFAGISLVDTHGGQARARELENLSKAKAALNTRLEDLRNRYKRLVEKDPVKKELVQARLARLDRRINAASRKLSRKAKLHEQAKAVQERLETLEKDLAKVFDPDSTETPPSLQKLYDERAGLEKRLAELRARYKSEDWVKHPTKENTVINWFAEAMKAEAKRDLQLLKDNVEVFSETANEFSGNPISQFIERNTLKADKKFSAMGENLRSLHAKSTQDPGLPLKPQPTVRSQVSESQTQARRQVQRITVRNAQGFGTSITQGEVNFVRGVLDELGMHQIGMTVGDVASLESMADAGVLSRLEMEAAKQKFNDPYQLALFIPTSGAEGVIIVRPPRREGPDVGAQRLLRIGHEIGHAVYNGIRERIENPQTDRDKALAERMQRAYERDRNQVGNYNAQNGFQEWFADKIAARAKKYVQTRPHSQVDHYFTKSARELKRTFDAVKGRLPKRFTRNTTFEDVVDAYRDDNVFANVRSIRGDGRMKDMNIGGQTISMATLRQARQQAKNFMAGADIRLTPGLYYLFDVHNMLQAQGFPKTADAILKETNTENSTAYWDRVNREFSRFEGRLYQIFPRGEYKAVAEQAFMQLALELPTHQLSTKAKQVRQMLEEFHAYLKESIPNIGKLDDFFPRVYAVNEINARAAEFVALFEKHGWSAKEASEVLESILVDDRAGVLDDNFIVGKTSHLNKHRRILDPNLVRALVREGFLNPDPYRTLMSYMRKSVRRAELERNFGGYRILAGWKTNPRGKADHDHNKQIVETYLSNYGYDVSTPAAYNNSYNQARQEKYLDVRNVGGRTLASWRDPIIELERMIDKEAINKFLPQVMNKLGMSQYDAQKAGLLDLDRMEWVDTSTGQVLPIVPEKENTHIRKLVRAALDANPPLDTDGVLYNLTGELRAYQSLRTLMFSGVASIPEFAALFARNKETLNLREFSRLSMDTIRHYNDARAVSEALGVASRDINDVILQEMLADHHRGKGRIFRRLIPALFHLNGNNAVMNLTRVVGTSLAQAFIVTNTRNAADTSLTQLERDRAMRYLREIGVDDLAEVQQWVADFANGRPQPYKFGEVSPINDIRRKMAGAINTFVGEAVLMPNAAQMPLYAKHPIGGLFVHLKTFMYGYNKQVMGGLYREGKSRHAENTGGGAGGIVPPGTPPSASAMGIPESFYRMLPFYLPVIGLFIAMGAASDELRHRIRTFGQRGTWESNWKDPERMVAKWVDRAGFTSLPYLGAVPIPGVQDVDPWDVAFAAGPVFSHGFELFSSANNGGLTRSDAMKAIPVLSQMTQLRQMVHNALD